jgi:phosphatidylinositol alpha-1,6-mannosyltransferase
MKVLLLTETAKPTSGWGRIVDELIKHYHTAGIETVILTEDGSGDGAILKNSLASLKSSLINSLKVRRYIKKCDIVHALDCYPYGLIAALATWGTKKRFVMTAIGTYAIMPLENPKLKPFMTWAYRRAAKIMPIVDYTTREISKRVSKLPPIQRVLLGVDVNRFHFSVENMEAATPFFLSVGALKKRRGNHFILPALALVKKDFPNIEYNIVGDPSDKAYVSHLNSEIKRLDLEKNVHILGKVPEETLLNLYQTCSAFVGVPDNTATNFAGFHLVYLEANAMGKPVIAGEGYGTEETLFEGENGFLVKPNNPESIASAMKKILSNQEMRNYMHHRSREIATTLTWEKTAAEYIEIYKQVLKK